MADKDNTTTSTPCYVFRLIKFDEQGNKIQKRKYGFTAKSTAADELDENVFNGIITRAEQTFNLRPSTYSLYLVLETGQSFTYELGETDLHLDDYPILSSHSWTALHTYNQFHHKRDLIAKLKADKKGRKVVNLCLVQTTLHDVAKAWKLKNDLEDKKKKKGAAEKGKGKAVEEHDQEEETVKAASTSSTSSYTEEKATSAGDASPSVPSPEVKKEDEAQVEQDEKRSTSPAGQAAQDVADLVAKFANFIAPLPMPNAAAASSSPSSGISGGPLGSHPGMEFIKRAADFIAPPPPPTATATPQPPLAGSAHNPVDFVSSLAAAAAKASGVSLATPNTHPFQSVPNKRRHWSEYLSDEIASANARRAAQQSVPPAASSHSPAAAAAMIEKNLSKQSASMEQKDVPVAPTTSGGPAPAHAHQRISQDALKAKMEAMRSYPFGHRSFLAARSSAPTSAAAGAARGTGVSVSRPASSSTSSSSNGGAASPPSATVAKAAAPRAISPSSNDKYATLKSSFDKFVNDFNANLADAFGGPAPDIASNIKKEEEQVEEKAQTVFEAEGEKESNTTHGKAAKAEHHTCGRSGNVDEKHAHNATCDVCDEWIIGTRYKCFVCPDWDCCERCFVKIDQVHPGHALAALQRPTDIIRRTPSSSAFDNNARHLFIHCDGCNKPISGIRYKCTHPSCPDFDLCATCEADPVPYNEDRKIGDHSFRNHLMVKIRKPVKPASALGGLVCDYSSAGAHSRAQLEKAIVNVRKNLPASMAASPVSATSATPTDNEKQGQDKSYVIDVPVPFAIPGGQKDIHLTFDIGTNDKGESVVVNRNGKASSSIQDAVDAAVKQAIAAAFGSSKAEQKAKEKKADKATTVTEDHEAEEKDGKKSEEEIVDYTEQKSQMKDARLMYDARWIDDVTFGDGESVFPGTVFNKIWDVENTGTKRWPEGTRLICVSGFGKDLASQHGGRKEVSYAVKSAAAGARVHIVAEDITAPEVGGKFMSYYRFVAPDGTRFGDRLWIDIIVDEDLRGSSVLKERIGLPAGSSEEEQEVKKSSSSLDSSRVVTPTLKVKGSASNIQDEAESAATTLSALTSPRSTASGLPDTESMLSEALSDDEEDCDFVLLSDDDEYDQV